MRASHIADLDPSTGTATAIDISASVTADWKFHGGVLAPNGHIYFIPMNADVVGDFDPCTGAYRSIDISAVMSRDWKFGGGVLAPNGHIYMMPYVTDGTIPHAIGNFDPSTEVHFNILHFTDSIIHRQN